MNLSISTWKRFRLGDLFDIRKGKRLTAEDQTEGTTPYVGAIDSNNGIANYIGQPAIHQGNTITLSYNGSVGEAFYQPVPFWATDDVNVLYFRSSNGVLFNYYLAMFICTVLRIEKYRYCYGRKWTLDAMNDTIIKLPAKGNRPDWEWMENYIKSLHSKPITTKVKKHKSTALKTNDWKEFYLYRIFNVSMGNGIDAITTTTDSPKYNYVSRDSNGNGVVGYIDEIEGEKPFPAGAMTLALGGSFLGSCFVQKKAFYTAQNVGVLQEKNEMSDYSKLFIATLIRNECKIKYQAFGRELNSHFRKDFTIKLPVKYDENGIILDASHEFSDEGYIPDWEWMENYMKSLPYSDRV